MGGVVQGVITNLYIEDFQSIETLDVECGSITVFIGESDTGKSAIVRAIYALAFNDYPKGHVRDGQTNSRIALTLDNGSVIRAIKGQVNQYEIDIEDVKMEGWDRVGTKVPEEVTEALGWRMLEIDDGTKFTPNFGRQFDPPFLITETPSKKAKLLGSLTNIATLYAAMKQALSRERENKTRLKTWTEVAEKASAEWEEVGDSMAVAENLLEGATERLKRIHKLDGEAGSLRIALEQVEAKKNIARGSARLLKEKESAVIDLGGVPEMMEEWTKLRRRVTTIHSMTEAVGFAKDRVGAAEAGQHRGQNALKKFVEDNPVCPLCGKGWHL